MMTMTYVNTWLTFIKLYEIAKWSLGRKYSFFKKMVNFAVTVA